MSKKRSRKEAELDEIPRIASAKVARDNKSKDALSITSNLKCQELFEALKTQLSEDGIETDCGGGYGDQDIKLCKNIRKGLENSKFLTDLRIAISSAISDKTEESLISDIISYLYDSRLIQLFEYFINNKMNFDLDDKYTYKDLMDHELLYYLSRHEVAANFVFEEDTKKLLSDVEDEKADPKYFINQLKFHDPQDYEGDFTGDMEEEHLFGAKAIQDVIKKYYNNEEWQLYSIFVPWIGDKEAMERARENFTDYDAEKEKYNMYPYCGQKYIVMHCTKEDEMVIFWGEYGMDFDWLDRP